MRIRSQDKLTLAQYLKIKVTKNFGAKTYAIVGDNNTDATVILGIYKDEDHAIMELDKIMSFFHENPFGIYQMS